MPILHVSTPILPQAATSATPRQRPPKLSLFLDGVAIAATTTGEARSPPCYLSETDLSEPLSEHETAPPTFDEAKLLQVRLRLPDGKIYSGVLPLDAIRQPPFSGKVLHCPIRIVESTNTFLPERLATRLFTDYPFSCNIGVSCEWSPRWIVSA